ncbi:hypothetical protein BD626DRAFT_88795 [Schizophyllum amplum]|uniref:Uncharacterized protein n=1 Tax=Schizophyllum amplum TaxID=97359 RepID=A0A550C896_9AGAR|nr:hypothetical protein BD626DRAFT_88795 [Auriculariopsis ampla]
MSLTACPSRNQHRSRKLARTFMRRTKGTGMDVYYRDAEAVTIDIITSKSSLCADRYTYARRGPLFLRAGHDQRPDRGNPHSRAHHWARVVASSVVTARWRAPSRLSVSVHGGRSPSAESLDHAVLVATASTLVLEQSLAVCTVPPPAGAPWSRLVCVYLEESPMGFDVFFE